MGGRAGGRAGEGELDTWEIESIKAGDDGGRGEGGWRGERVGWVDEREEGDGWVEDGWRG